MIDTKADVQISEELAFNYFKTLVNRFFKILPIRENEETTLGTYMRSLQVELLGSGSLIQELDYDSDFLTLASILQYLIDNDLSTKEVKREVFKAISICNKLKDRYEKCTKVV